MMDPKPHGNWIKIEDELPIQNWHVRVKNGKKILEARYYRKKWYSYHQYDVWDDGELRPVRLHQVTEWEKHWTYPSVPQKDMRAFFRRAQKYRTQMKSKEMKFIFRGVGDWVPPKSHN